MTDVRGLEFAIGDIVAYPGRSGSSAYLTVAEVLAIIPKGNHEIIKFGPKGKLRVKPMTRSRFGSTTPLTSKPRILQRTDLVVIVDRA